MSRLGAGFTRANRQPDGVTVATAAAAAAVAAAAESTSSSSVVETPDTVNMCFSATF